MLTVQEVKAIFERPEAKWRVNSEHPVIHTFALGYTMMTSLVAKKIGEELHLVIHPDSLGEIQTFKVEDLIGMMEEHVKELGRQGFYLCESTRRISYKLLTKDKRTT